MKLGKGLLALAGVAATMGLPLGCKPDATMSKEDVQQLKQGPSKEMPPQARKMMEEASRAGHGPPPPGQSGGAGTEPRTQ